ncbi:MAG: hypothetical protein JWQ57_756 [Mucilaginibacter sp.]|nr:hypothetical protein [Mucilaginibacter sp.]
MLSEFQVSSLCQNKSVTSAYQKGLFAPYQYA